MTKIRNLVIMTRRWARMWPNSSQPLTITTTGESPWCWKSPATCIINIVKFLESARSYERFIKRIKDVLKENAVVFLVDKQSRKISPSTKDIVIWSLISLEVKPRRVIKETDFFTTAYSRKLSKSPASSWLQNTCVIWQYTITLPS